MAFSLNGKSNMLEDKSDGDLRFLDEEDFKYLRYDWVSDDPKLLKIAALLSEQWKDKKTPQRRSTRDFDTAFNVVLSAIEVCSGYERDWIRIPTYDAIYGGATQRSPAFNRDVLTAVNWLIEETYLLEVDGRRVVPKVNSSEMIYLPKAYTLSCRWRDEISASPISEPSYIRRNPLSGFIQVRKTILKGKKKLKVQIQPRPVEQNKNRTLISGTNRLLTDYDSLMRKTAITLNGEPIPSHRTTLTRIFSNSSYDEGGRFYGSMQSWKKEVRRKLHFNDQKVVEVDFTAIHPTILYELEGLNAPAAPYKVSGFERDEVKVAFNILINRKATRNGSDTKSVASNLNLSIKRSAALCSGLYKIHQGIKHRFNTGFGLHLQRIDSDIMFDVLEHFVAVAKQPIIPIHDSAIVRSEDVATLFLVMRESYYRHLQMRASSAAAVEVFDVDEGKYVREPFTASGMSVGIKTSGFDEQLDAYIEYLLKDI